MLESSACLFLLLISYTTVTGQQTCSDNGAIQLIGIKTDTFAAGRLEICVNGILRVVYDTFWDGIEARLVCQQLGYSAEGALSCARSCFGASSLERGYTEFRCFRSTSLISCGRESSDGHFPGSNAGVICTTGSTPPEVNTSISQCPTQLPTNPSTLCPEAITLPPPSSSTCNCSSCNESPSATIEGQGLETPFTTPATPPTTSSDSPGEETAGIEGSQERVETGNNCTAVGTALGIICALLLFALVGVVIGWVWFYNKNRLTLKKRTSSNNDFVENTLDNPIYLGTEGMAIPSVHYSSLGPANTLSSNNTLGHSLPQHEDTYQVVQPEEGVAYEVPEVQLEEGVAYEVPEVQSEEGVDYEVPLQSLANQN